MNQREWSRTYYEGNMFALDSASFYIAARHLLLSMTFSGVKPGLVNGAYSLEYLLKAALTYKDIQYPKSGRTGHNLYHLANLLDHSLANELSVDLNLFYDYFNSRYFMHPTDRNGMYSYDVHKLDTIYRKIYELMNVPLGYHYGIGVLARASIGSEAMDLKALSLRNEEYTYYDDLRNRSLAASGMLEN